MKKKKLTTDIINKMQSVKKQVMNSLSGDASELRDALIALFDELENAEDEFDINQFKSEIESIVAKYSDVPEATANAISKAVENVMKRIENSLPKSEQLTPAVKNQVAAAILKAHDKVDAQNRVKDVMVKNGISGLEFEAAVDYVVDWKIEDLNPLFGKLHKTMLSKFFYGEVDFADKDQIAHGWLKTNEGEKLIQQLTANGKRIDNDYIYKRQQFAFKDLDEIEQAGQLTQFLSMISKELDLMIVNAVVTAILVGDSVNASTDKIYTFETIGTKTASDAFTTVVTNSDADLAAYLTSIDASNLPPVSQRLATLRYVADQLWNPAGKEVLAVMSKRVLSSLAPRVIASGGDLVFRTKDEIAAELGVSDIFVTDVMPKTLDTEDAAKAGVIFIIPDGYHYKEVKAIDVAYPTYEKNVQNIQKERNMGGGIRDLYSTAVYRINGTKASSSSKKA